MQVIRINFPGIRMRFDKSLLRNIVENIQNQLTNIEIKWFKCKAPFTIVETPLEYSLSDLSEANMVILEKNGMKILESFQYHSGGGSILVYEQNLPKDDLRIILKILQGKGFKTPGERIDFKIIRKALLFQGLAVIYLFILWLNMDHIFSLSFWPNAPIVITPPIILICISFYFLLKAGKKKY